MPAFHEGIDETPLITLDVTEAQTQFHHDRAVRDQFHPFLPDSRSCCAPELYLKIATRTMKRFVKLRVVNFVMIFVLRNFFFLSQI